jgi:long-subunit fatty acid transport protein
VLLAADVRHTDYQEIEDKVGASEFFLRPYYRDVTSFAIGAEVLAPGIPLRLRGGYRYDPAPFRLTYCPTGDCGAGEGRDPREIDVAIDRERRFFSAGAGYLFDGVFAVDIAFETGSYERVIEGPDPDLYQEERHADQYVLTLGYRF